MPMGTINLSNEELAILCRFMGFPDFFSVDWLTVSHDLLPSRLISVISFLEKRRWISVNSERLYEWTPKFPREEILNEIPALEMSRYYREALNTLIEHLPKCGESSLRLAKQCLLAGIQKTDVDIIFEAAIFHERSHNIRSAIELYDHLLCFARDLIFDKKDENSSDLCQIFIKSVERRASLSLFHPNLKKVYHFLGLALDLAVSIGDVRSEAALQLLIGQNCWMSFQYDNALNHFHLGWMIINKIDDDELRKRGLKLQGLSYWIRGELSKAIQAYEASLGELELVAVEDFSLLTALSLTLCYSQLGMPQRGLGLSETIYNQAMKNENWPIAAYALITTGTILLQIEQRKNSYNYFSMALELSAREGIPMVEVIAGLGLSDLECLEGNFDKAAEYFKVLWKIPKSSWYHALNISHTYEAGFLLYRKGISPVELNPVIHYLSEITKEQTSPLAYGIVRRMQIKHLEEDKSPKEKLMALLELENYVEQMGPTLDLAKIRIDIARIYLQINNWQQAENYGKKAWEFLKPIGRGAFPSDLEHLIPHENEPSEDLFFDFLTEMSVALANQENLEQLLANIITSISRLTGAERTAIFIKNRISHTIDLAASRNLIKENIIDESFREAMEIIESTIDTADSQTTWYEINKCEAHTPRRAIVIPLMIGHKAIGVLYQDSRFFSFDTNSCRIKMLSPLASLVAICMDRFHAYEKIDNLNKRLALGNRHSKSEKEEVQPLEEILGDSDSIIKLHGLIRKVAPTQSTVLIYGETGVGKELVARAIHRESLVRKGPFIRVNCAALPDTLIDSELFGHEKGSFTGAIRTKPGRFELANKGTIFLDEVSELPLSTQRRLLRILQEKEFQRVGGTATLHSDFRLVAATNKNLKEEIDQKRFRADLFFRINVFPINVIPLRERKKDVPLLAEHFLKHFCAKYNKSYPGISDSEMEKLEAYSWPGNIRELSNVIEQSVILGESQIGFPDQGIYEDLKTQDNLLMDMKEMERAHITKALKRANGKIGGRNGASTILGLKRTTLIHRMKKLGIAVQKNPS
ncbi:MAG: sigma 54-interacting transcriptional regulator [Desulfomonilaceae bacterium]|jgi:transcriptional regulator with GAF, ATPase, and Fis domain